MQVENKVHPSDAQMAEFTEPGPDGPIYMVNLLKFKERAEYEDGSDNGLTGAEAYAQYATVVAGLVEKTGGKIEFMGEVTRLMLGEVEDLWDQVGIARYPSRQAMLEMMMSKEYQAIHHHRDAGLAGQLNIECANPFLPG